MIKVNEIKGLSDFQLVNRYRCVVNGNQIVKLDFNKKSVLRVCEKYARNGFYTELWYTYESGKSILVNYWN